MRLRLCQPERDIRRAHERMYPYVARALYNVSKAMLTSSSAATCSPPCNNGGRCFQPNYDDPRNLTCQCLSGYSGKSCDFRCFFPIPVDIVSCEGGVYVIRADLNVPANSSLNVLLQTDARIIRVNGSIVIQRNSSASFASNTTNRIEVNVNGNLTQLAGSIITTSIIGLRNNSLFGTLISVSGTVNFAGTLEIQIDGKVLSNLTQGQEFRFEALSYGDHAGEFANITTNLPAVLTDGCSRPISTAEYGAKSLAIVVTIDSSRCGGSSGANGSPTNGANSNEVPGLGSSAATSPAVIGGSVAAAIVVVVAAVVVGVVLKKRKETIMRRHFKQAFQNSETPTSATSSTNSVELQTAAPGSRSSSSWKAGRAGNSISNS